MKCLESDSMGGRIYDLLIKARMSQKELADKIGVTEVSLHRYIRGERIPKGPTVAKIAKELHTTTDYILGNEIEVDAEIAYYKARRFITKHSKEWSQKMKAELVNALLDAGE